MLKTLQKSHCIVDKLDDTYLILQKVNYPHIPAGNIHDWLQKELNIISEDPDKINGVTCSKEEVIIALKEPVTEENTKQIINSLNLLKVVYGQNINRNSHS